MIKTAQLKSWLIDYITNSIHNLKSSRKDMADFNKWAKSFKKEEASFVVNMEYVVDWGYEKRESIPIEEAKDYAQLLIQKIVDKWYI